MEKLTVIIKVICWSWLTQAVWGLVNVAMVWSGLLKTASVVVGNPLSHSISMVVLMLLLYFIHGRDIKGIIRIYGLRLDRARRAQIRTGLIVGAAFLLVTVVAMLAIRLCVPAAPPVKWRMFTDFAVWLPLALVTLPFQVIVISYIPFRLQRCFSRKYTAIIVAALPIASLLYLLCETIWTSGISSINLPVSISLLASPLFNQLFIVFLLLDTQSIWMMTACSVVIYIWNGGLAAMLGEKVLYGLPLLQQNSVFDVTVQVVQAALYAAMFFIWLAIRKKVIPVLTAGRNK